MEGMIWNANHVLDTILDPKTPFVPRSILQDCKGVALISVIEAGFVFSGNVGTGVVLAQDGNGKWSPPSAIGMGGVGFGWMFGAAVKDVLLVLMDDPAVNALCGEGQVKLGGEVALALGPVGREVEGGINLSNKGSGLTFTYVMSQGLFLGVGLEGAAIGARFKENERFYGKKVSPQEIVLGGAVSIPEGKGIEDLHRKLDLLKEGRTYELTEEEKEKKETLKAAAEERGKTAKAEQGDEVKYIDAEEEAEKEKTG